MLTLHKKCSIIVTCQVLVTHLLLEFKMLQFPTNVSEIAKELKVSRQTVYRNLELLGYDQDVFKTDEWKTKIVCAKISDRHMIALISKLRSTMEENKQFKQSLEATKTTQG